MKGGVIMLTFAEPAMSDELASATQYGDFTRFRVQLEVAEPER